MSANIKKPLLCHPNCCETTIRKIQVGASWSSCGILAVSYRIEGNPATFVIPGPQSPAAADDLWQHTCCEAFIAAVDGTEYREFNFSPSGQWANYRFSDYRKRDTEFSPLTSPQIIFRHRDDGFELDALLARDLLPKGTMLNIGLAVVIESTDGKKNYWALQHCAEQPDFHLRQSFSLTLHMTQP